MIALNKIDLIDKPQLNKLVKKFEKFGFPVFPISGVTGTGLDPLMDACSMILDEAVPVEDIPVILPAMQAQGEDFWEIIKEEEGYRVQGKRLERMVAMTDLESRDAVRYLQRRLEKIGVFSRLRDAGIEEGDDVIIGELEFEFTDER